MFSAPDKRQTKRKQNGVSYCMKCHNEHIGEVKVGCGTL